MAVPTHRLPLIFSGLGHFYIHLFTAFYFTIVLTLEARWRVPYHELIDLWWLGGLLVGLAALPAGRLADRWSAVGMMLVFFFGMGAASIACGFADGTTVLFAALAGIGFFAAIYHPVGIPWVIRTARSNTGKALAVNGIFGSLGVAGAGSAAGWLAETWGWRAAFIVPGVVCCATGLAMLVFVLAGRITDDVPEAPSESAPSRADMLRVFLILIVSMFFAGVIYQSCQAAFPKLFSERIPGFVGGSPFRAGLLVTVVYGIAAFVQIIGGHLADRYSLRRVYLLAWLCQIGVLVLLSGFAGFSLFAFAILAASISVAQLPAENLLLARYTPQSHHGLAFGVKFVLAFGATPLAVMLISWTRESTGGFSALFLGLAGVTFAVSLLLFALPADRARPVRAAIVAGK